MKAFIFTSQKTGKYKIGVKQEPSFFQKILKQDTSIEIISEEFDSVIDAESYISANYFEIDLTEVASYSSGNIKKYSL